LPIGPTIKARPSAIPPLKVDQIGNSIIASSAAISLSIFHAHRNLLPFPWPPHTHTCSSHQLLMKVLTASCFLSDREVLQWRPTADEDIPTPNTNKIVVFASFFQCGFGFLVCNFLRGLLDHYQIELVHHNPNSIL
jgi:hypothetical protein